jgi:hypothetical protein
MLGNLCSINLSFIRLEKMMAISMQRAKTLCNASELELVRASTRQEIGKLSAARLRQKETRARKLRDKWQDQTKNQKRSAQAKTGSRAASANKNSAAKAELFDEVLGRFSTRLAKVEAAGETAGPKGRRRSTKTARSATHRAVRAEVRAKLAEKKRSLKTKPKTKKASPAKVKPTTAETSEEEIDASATETPTPRKSKKARPPIGTHASAVEAGRKAQGLRVTKRGQLAARTAAKQDRLKASGLIRIQKNRSAANKRKQSKRDSR